MDNLKRFRAHTELDLLAHPYVMHLLWDTVTERIWPPNLIPMTTAEGEVSPEGDNFAPWLEHGAKIKTRSSFGRNVRAVVNLAKQKGEPLVLMTFAHYLAHGYTLERFKNKSLDYAKHDVPTEVWGIAPSVSRGVDAHNEVIRGIAHEHRGVHFVDMAKAIPRGKINFDDICHLSLEGRKAWVQATLGKAMEVVGTRK